MAAKRIMDKMFGKYLFFTNVGGLGILLGAGDVIEQTLVERVISDKKDMTIDTARTVRMTGSILAVAPWYHVWYTLLDKKLPGRSIRTVAKKSLLDLVIQAPVSCFVWIQALGFMEGHHFKQNTKDFVVKFPPFMMGEVLFWVPAQAVNFYLLPPKYRVMYVGFVSLIYSTFLSFLGNEYGKEEIKDSGIKEDMDDKTLQK